ncbi:hypothetical protein G3I44_04150 [Halogeometricum borinquense]|uniref:Uncharacterized protein n=1 Tax=Halogeometricum borinquense TaxID=60847 RepID=A0A6C0UDX3_9EURY|nr:hypothetical protein [Halogeometricum borinquense]QIB73545.1 hypothetical protein G3I44_04150 [Halogeometricum borinquense]
MTTEKKIKRVYRILWPELPDGEIRLTNMREEPIAVGFLALGIAIGYLMAIAVVELLVALASGSPMMALRMGAAVGLAVPTFGISMRQCEDCLRGVDARDDLTGIEEVSG